MFFIHIPMRYAYITERDVKKNYSYPIGCQFRVLGIVRVFSNTTYIMLYINIIQTYTYMYIYNTDTYVTIDMINKYEKLYMIT